MAQPSRRRAQGGMSLIEVLIAVLIFSVGLIGLAGLLVTATRSNHTAFVRTQVSFLVSNMADRMRANPVALWNKNYDGTYPATGTTPACSAAKPCAPDQLATRDGLIWGAQMKAFLPGLDSAVIACDASSAGYKPSTEIPLRPPYGGICTITVKWAERGYTASDDQTDSSNLQSYTWKFEP